MLKFYVLILLFLFPTFNLIGSSLTLTQERDSLETLYNKINHFIDADEFDSIPRYNSLLLKESSKQHNTSYIGKHYFIKSYYFDIGKSKKDSAYFYAHKALKYFKNINDSLAIGKLHLSIAGQENETGAYHDSNASALQAIKHFSSSKSRTLLAIAYDIIANNYQHLQLHDDAIINQEKAIAFQTKDSLIYINNLASIYNSIHDYSSAIQLLSNININALERPKDKALIIDNLTYYQWLQNPLLNAESQLLEALEIRTSNNDKSGLADSYKSLANYYAGNHPKEALNYTQKLINISKDLIQPKTALKGLKIMMRIAPNDLSPRNRYIELIDSLDRTHLQTRNQYAKIKYDNVEALQENDRLKQKNKHQRLVYAFFAVIAFILFVFYIYYSFQKRKLTQQKHEKEKLQEVFKTENKISKKVHDEIANGIYQIMISEQASKQPPEDSNLDKLDRLYKQARNISHQISEININEGYVGELKEMFSDFQDPLTKIIATGIDTINWKNIDAIKKETLYRILNELMVNMKKHSHAELVVVNFTELENKINIKYSDDGVGLSNKALKNGSGFKNMESRIHSLQGTFIFDSNLNKGLKVHISFPS